QGDGRELRQLLRCPAAAFGITNDFSHRFGDSFTRDAYLSALKLREKLPVRTALPQKRHPLEFDRWQTCQAVPQAVNRQACVKHGSYPLRPGCGRNSTTFCPSSVVTSRMVALAISG